MEIATLGRPGQLNYSSPNPLSDQREPQRQTDWRFAAVALHFANKQHMRPRTE
ncbi:MAG TPA: hypothetical protein VF456_00155 [Vicinamibacterales bacterium]